jgi:hypothetical protein
MSLEVNAQLDAVEFVGLMVIQGLKQAHFGEHLLVPAPNFGADSGASQLER